MLNIVDILIDDVFLWIQNKLETYLKKPLISIFGNFFGGILSFTLGLFLLLVFISIPFIILILLGNR